MTSDKKLRRIYLGQQNESLGGGLLVWIVDLLDTNGKKQVVNHAGNSFGIVKKTEYSSAGEADFGETVIRNSTSLLCRWSPGPGISPPNPSRSGQQHR
ncbi:MAG: hypothetical protein WBD20_27105 [Pirellulaceae bacterium]